MRNKYKIGFKTKAFANIYATLGLTGRYFVYARVGAQSEVAQGNLSNQIEHKIRHVPVFLAPV